MACETNRIVTYARQEQTLYSDCQWKRQEPVSANAWQLKLLMIRTQDCNKPKLHNCIPRSHIVYTNTTAFLFKV